MRAPADPKKTKAAPKSSLPGFPLALARAASRTPGSAPELDHVLGSRSLLALDHVELHPLTLG
jgi:hypothetical protein